MNSKFMAIGLVAMTMAACGGAPVSQVDPALEGAENTSFPSGAQIDRSGNLEQNFQVNNGNISFSNGRYSGNTGCNDFNGTYTMTGPDTVRIEPMVLTRRACFDNRLMQEEANFAQNLPGDYQIVTQGASVVLLNDQRSWVFATSVQ